LLVPWFSRTGIQVERTRITRCEVRIWLLKGPISVGDGVIVKLTSRDPQALIYEGPLVNVPL